jgi:cell division protein FtsB
MGNKIGKEHMLIERKHYLIFLFMFLKVLIKTLVRLRKTKAQQKAVKTKDMGVFLTLHISIC